MSIYMFAFKAKLEIIGINPFVFDPTERSLVPHPELEQALTENDVAKAVFDRLAPSKRKEIIRYISFLKTDESRRKNIEKAIGFLLGKNRFIGREKPE